MRIASASSWLLLLGLALSNLSLEARAAPQCAMCRNAVEADAEAGGNLGRALNASILFMLSIPYLLLGTGAVLLYRASRKKRPQASGPRHQAPGSS